MAKERKIRAMRVFAEQIRLETMTVFGRLGQGHVGGAMSVIEALAVLYGGEMRFDAKNPGWAERDRLVLSKGHAGPALYSALSLLGFFPQSMLSELNAGGGRLPSHCDMNLTPGVDMTTGSLGQGISTAIGLALAARMDGRDSMTYLIMGDGELNEGQVWEGAMFVAHHKLSSLVALIDKNGRQLDGDTKDVLDMGDLRAKFDAFGWDARDVDGHDIGAICDAIAAARRGRGPSALILHTVKGHGCSFAEKEKNNHHMTLERDVADEELRLMRDRLLNAQAALMS